MNENFIPLFPLNVVLFPGGLLPLRIFETRYLDMVANCIKTKTPFGVVSVLESLPTRTTSRFAFADIGTTASIIDFEVPHPGLMFIRSVGVSRFRVIEADQRNDGLWIGQIERVADDLPVVIPADLQLPAENLRKLIITMVQQDVPDNEMPVVKPYKFDDCGWVANRWSEFIDIPLSQKQRLLELDSPLIRLELINDMFTSRNISS